MGFYYNYNYLHSFNFEFLFIKHFLHFLNYEFSFDKTSKSITRDGVNTKSNNRNHIEYCAQNLSENLNND